MVSASVEFITTRRAVKAAAVEIDAQQLIAHLQSRFGGQVSDAREAASWERVAAQIVVRLIVHLQRRVNAQVNLSMCCLDETRQPCLPNIYLVSPVQPPVGAPALSLE